MAGSCSKCGIKHLDPRGNPGCTAHSSRTGRACRGFAIAGGKVCRSHGGAAPQVQASAAERLRQLLTPALDRLAELIRSESGHVAMRAIELVIEKAGTSPDSAARGAIAQLIEELERGEADDAGR